MAGCAGPLRMPAHAGSALAFALVALLAIETPGRAQATGAAEDGTSTMPTEFVGVGAVPPAPPVDAAPAAAAAPNPENAVKFLEFLTSDFAQSHFASQNNEYPAVQGAPGVEAKDRLGDFKADDTTPTAAFSRNAKAAQTIFNEVGWD